ncbi:hypothetical protein [Microbacterium testaceum]|uniref:Uncharacterized protein n=1 Tax=Microbacterium testaceum TaxID=2033 RepID=A0A147F5X5_MICTE|nr:hypothetical protein [Microbacterium testaceum]KTS09906.1 hypothetical protein RSA3_12255 [Microbacterium testaceum]
MTITNDTAVGQEADAALTSIRPVWADDAFTRLIEEPHECKKVRFAVRMDGIEVYQYADDKGGTFALVDEPRLQPGTLPDLDALSLDELGEIGSAIVRLTQYVALANGTATDVGALRMTDLLRIAALQRVTPAKLLIAVGRRAEVASA